MTFTPPAGLSPTQSKLFAQLADGEWHSAGALLNNALGRRFASDSLVPTHIGRLRKVLPEHMSIENVVGGGYRLTIQEPTNV
jgi:DNA-binding response OmpR family regulator